MGDQGGTLPEGLEAQRVFAAVARSMLGEPTPLPSIGRFEVRERIGSGGMGDVYGGYDPERHRDVAIKVLHRLGPVDPTAASRLRREARALAKLQHVNVVEIFEVGDTPHGTFIAMERLYGESLAELLARHGVLAPSRTLAIIRQLGAAIAEAHAHGIVHRDLKPANVWVVEDEHVKVLDFGVAKGLPAALSMASLGASTATGAVLGTPLYMSPEQARDSGKVDERADLWAIAVITYECMVGELPFRAENIADLVTKILVDAPPTPSLHGKVPAGFDAWFLRATDRDPDRRFGSAQQLIEQLELALAGDSAPPAARPGAWAFVIVAVGLAAIGLAVLSPTRPSPASDSEARPNVGLPPKPTTRPLNPSDEITATSAVGATTTGPAELETPAPAKHPEPRRVRKLRPPKHPSGEPADDMFEY